jgi:hypothetical protein
MGLMKLTNIISLHDVIFKLLVLYESISNSLTIMAGDEEHYQGILSIEKHNGEFELYIWYDEGEFLDCFDTKEDDEGDMRLRIIGVDLV